MTTKRELLEKGVEAIPPETYANLPVAHQPQQGQVSRVQVADAISLGKIMAAGDIGVAKHLRGNVGACIRVVFQAVEWNMSPYSVGDMSYIVGDRLSYMSQLLHAVVEANAPLQQRLECEYIGTGETRQCIVRGYFIGGEVRDYTTPMIKDVRIKNSPLWKDDPDQQLFYYASRSWARKWVPDILLGAYTREELQQQPELAVDNAPGLHARLAGKKSSEGHKAGHAESELDQIVADRRPSKEDDEAANIIEGEVIKPPEGLKPDASAAKPAKPAKAKAKAEGKPRKMKEVEVDPETQPRWKTVKPDKWTVADYQAYFSNWLAAAESVGEIAQRWNDERRIRNNIGMTAEDRAPMDVERQKRCEQL